MSLANKQRLIKAAREAGLSDIEILQEVLRGEYGSERRRKLVVEWGELHLSSLSRSGGLQPGIFPAAYKSSGGSLDPCFLIPPPSEYFLPQPLLFTLSFKGAVPERCTQPMPS
jgi:hypothetical protein